MWHSRLPPSLRSPTSHRALRGKTGLGPSGRPEDNQPHRGSTTKGRPGLECVRNRGWQLDGSQVTDSTPRSGKKGRGTPLHSGLSCSHLGIPASSPFGVNPGPLISALPGGRLHQCDMIYTPLQAPTFTHHKLSPKLRHWDMGCRAHKAGLYHLR